MNRQSGFHRLALAATVLALVVVMLGAYVRLSDAGLGCPDWPGCFGQITWPEAESEIQSAAERFPERPVDAAKAWKEMVHRYLAGILGLMVLAMAWLSIRQRHQALIPRWVPPFLLLLIIFQAALGMWTVTLKLKPIIVMAHLLGGMATLALLTWCTLRSRAGGLTVTGGEGAKRLRRFWLLALIALLGQIALGGWVSANYAAIACPDLPTCQGQWWPEADWGEAFVLWREVGVDYEGGILDHSARVAIQLAHRAGALALVLVMALFLWALAASHLAEVRKPLMLLAAALAAQLTLGVLNILWVLPLPVAVAHNVGAALLIMAMVFTLHRLSPRR